MKYWLVSLLLACLTLSAIVTLVWIGFQYPQIGVVGVGCFVIAVLTMGFRTLFE